MRMRFAAILTVSLVVGSSALAQSSVRRTAAPTQRDSVVHPRDISASALRAASNGALARWGTPWQQQLRAHPTDRTAMFAVAAQHRLTYNYPRADSLYARIAAGNANDRLGNQSQLWRALIRVNDGRYAAAGAQFQAITTSALQATDTLTALDAILAWSGVVSRTESANAALAVLARGDSLNWRRDPALDAGSRCRSSALYSRLGNSERARSQAREGISIATRAQLGRLSASCLFTLATDFARKGLSDSLRGPLITSIELLEKTGDLASLAAAKQWAGYYLLALGQIPLAQAQLAGAWDVSQRAHTTNVSAWIALNRAAVAQTFYDAAGNNLWLDRADTLMRSIDDLQGRVELSRMLAIRAQRAGDLTAADMHLRSGKVAADRLAEPSLQFSNLAAQWDLAMQRGNLNEADRLLVLRNSVANQYKLNGWQIDLMGDQAQIWLRRNEPEKALPLLKKSLSSMHESQHIYIYQSETEQALALSQMGDIRGASQLALTAAETFDRWRASISDRTLQSLSAQSQRGQGWFNSTLIANLADAGEVTIAFSLTERLRARELRDRLSRASTGGNDTDSVPEPSKQTAMSVADIQRALRDNQTAIVMINAGENGARGTAFVLTRTLLTAHAMPTLDSVAPRVRRLVALLESGRDANIESRALGASLIAPLLPRLESAEIKRIVFIPEGVLHRLPFDVLRLPDGRFLVERFETAVAPSATVLMQLAATPLSKSDATNVLAFADAQTVRPHATDSIRDSPILSSILTSATFLPRLLGARKEVAEVQKFMSGTVVRTGTNATETAIKHESASYDVLHFATHAVVDEWSGASAALALTPTATDDGLLDSGEIARLGLNASLVLLSACRTVGGEVIAGEGVRGLTSAFLQAGARSVIATSWRVNDRDVVPVVASIYQELGKRQPVGAALRTAQLAAIRRKVSPTVWGAFTLVGDPWRVVSGGR